MPEQVAPPQPPVASALRPPDARQGPGPMPNGLVEALEPAVNRLVAQLLPGGRRAVGVGFGTELAQLRPYETGDDVRHIDAAASARTGVLHSRLHVPERTLTTWIVLDLSPSMAFGTARRLKADVAEGVALVFGRLGLRRAGSVGVVAFGVGDVWKDGAKAWRILPPRGSKPGMIALRRLLAEGVAPDRGERSPGGSSPGGRSPGESSPHESSPHESSPGGTSPHELAGALGRVNRLASHPGLVVLISDFRDQQDWERPLGALRLRHATVAVEVADPREAELPAAGRLALVDPETGELIQVNSDHGRIRERFAALERERREAIAAELRRLGIRHVRLSTDQDWLVELGHRIG